MNEVKICKNCKHVAPDSIFLPLIGLSRYRFAKCGRPGKNTDEYLVTGNPRDNHYCSVERIAGSTRCGPEGRYYEAKE